MALYEENVAKQADVGIDELPAIRREMQYLSQAVDRLDHQAGLLIEKVDQVTRPYDVPTTSNAVEMVGPATSDLARQILRQRDLVTSIADRLASTFERVEL